MPKFRVEREELGVRTNVYHVEAEDADEAAEMSWEIEPTRVTFKQIEMNRLSVHEQS